MMLIQDAGQKQMAWLLAFVAGLINQHLLLQCELPKTESCAPHVSGKLRLSDPERCTLAEIGKRSAGNICRR
jgi:hypothetical protein